MMLKLGTFGTTSTFLNLKYKRFKDSNGKLYKGDQTVLIAEKNNIFSNVTKESYNKFYKQHKEKLVQVTEVTAWRKKVDNLSISKKFGTSRRTWKYHKKNGQEFSTTLKNRGTAKIEKDR